MNKVWSTAGAEATNIMYRLELAFLALQPYIAYIDNDIFEMNMQYKKKENIMLVVRFLFHLIKFAPSDIHCLRRPYNRNPISVWVIQIRNTANYLFYIKFIFLLCNFIIV